MAPIGVEPKILYS